MKTSLQDRRGWARSDEPARVMRAMFGVIAILPYTNEDARATAALGAALQKKGRIIGTYDTLLAGCALARGLRLVTSNEREFSRVSGLTIENWRK